MRYDPLPPGDFADRRQSFFLRMKSGSVALFYSSPSAWRSGDSHFPYRQDSDLFAMCGIDQPETILVLSTLSRKETAFVFVLPQDRRNAIWNGKRYTPREISEISGIDQVFTLSKWNRVMDPVFSKALRLYAKSPSAFGQQKENGVQQQLASILLANQHLERIDMTPILQQIRMVKTTGEQNLMHRAIEATGNAFREVLCQTKAGIREYELESVITAELIRRGCTHAFDPIIASGKSACTLHYIRNDGLLRQGQLVLLDFGAEYACMASDMSRTIPVSGRFSQRQLALYQSVLRILHEVTSFMRPGISLKDLNTETGKLMDAELVRLGLLSRKTIRSQLKSDPARRKYFMHGVSHHLGYDVHDLSDPDARLKAGMVLTCEPGLYVPEEKTGIRLENDILITRGSPRNLMKDIPVEPEEIEYWMQQPAI